MLRANDPLALDLPIGTFRAQLKVDVEVTNTDQAATKYLSRKVSRCIGDRTSDHQRLIPKVKGFA